MQPLLEQLAQSAQYPQRRAAIARWNAASPVLKRGLALTPENVLQALSGARHF